jgi:hypothetical protein
MRPIASMIASITFAASSFGQAPPPLPVPMMNILAFSELSAAQTLGGGAGPEDVAFNAVTNRVYVAHDFPNASPDLLLEYQLDGTLVAVTQPAGFTANGMCALPNGNLVIAPGPTTLLEIDVSGTPVPGGINATLQIPPGTGFVGVQDLDEYQGLIYCHDGNSGTVVTYAPSSNTTTILFSNVDMQTQAMSVHPTTGEIWIAKPFFQGASTPSGALPNGTLRVLSQAGVELYRGNSASNPRLSHDLDPLCFPAAQGSLTLPNGFDFMPNGDLWVDNFLQVGPAGLGLANVLRFRPSNLASAMKVGTVACVGSNNMQPTAVVNGAPQFGSVFSIGVVNGIGGIVALLGASPGRDCLGSFSLGAGCPAVLDVNQLISPDPVSGFGIFGLDVSGGATIPIDLTQVMLPPIDIYVQWALVDPFLASQMTVSDGYRLHLAN